MSESLAWELLSRCPYQVLRFWGHCLAKMHYRFDQKHVLECERMVQRCQKKWDAKHIVKGMYHSLWQIPSDIAFFHKTSHAILDAKIDGLEVFLEELQTLGPKDGIIFVSAHLGPWELCSQTISRRFRPVQSIYKPNRREWINRFFRAARHHYGQITVPKEGGMVSLFKHLKRGGVAGLVIDQHGGPQGIKSQFLGMPCRSWDSAVLLAQRTGCPIMAVGLIRSQEGYRLLHSKSLSFPKKFVHHDELAQAVLSVDTALSQMVEQAPEQWMWLGRRWGRDFETQMKELP